MAFLFNPQTRPFTPSASPAIPKCTTTPTDMIDQVMTHAIDTKQMSQQTTIVAGPDGTHHIVGV